MKGKSVASWFYALLPVAVRAVFSLLMNKWIAVFYGPAGISLLAQFQNAFSIVLSIPSDSSGRAFIKEISSSKANSSSEPVDYTIQKQWWQIVLLFNIAIVLLLSSAFIGIFYAGDGFSTTERLFFVFVAALVSVVFAYAQQHLQYLQATKHLLPHAQWSIVSTLVSGVVALVFFQYQWLPLAWVLLLWVALQSLLLYIGLYRLIPFTTRLHFVLNSLPWRQLLQFVGATATIALLGKLTDFGVRTYAIQTIGEEATGIYQSLVKIGEIYFVPLNALLGMLFFPSIAALSAADRSEDSVLQQRLLGNWLVALGALAALGLLIIYFFAEPIVLLLNSPSFIPSVDILPYQLPGDFFKVLTYIMATYALAKGYLKFTIISELLSVGLYMGLLWYFHRDFSPLQWAIIHSIRYAGYFIIWLMLIFIAERGNEKS